MLLLAGIIYTHIISHIIYAVEMFKKNNMNVFLGLKKSYIYDKIEEKGIIVERQPIKRVNRYV